MKSLAMILAVLLALVGGLYVGSLTGDKEVEVGVGGLASPDLYVGSMRLYSQKTDQLTQATGTVICALQPPAGTSTLLHATIELSSNDASSTESSLSFSNSATNATIGTVIASTSVAAGADITFSSASSTVAVSSRTFGPNSWLVVAHKPVAGVTRSTGVCQALWVPTSN